MKGVGGDLKVFDRQRGLRSWHQWKELSCCYSVPDLDGPPVEGEGSSVSVGAIPSLTPL